MHPAKVKQKCEKLKELILENHKGRAIRARIEKHNPNVVKHAGFLKRFSVNGLINQLDLLIRDETHFYRLMVRRNNWRK